MASRWWNIIRQNGTNTIPKKKKKTHLCACLHAIHSYDKGKTCPPVKATHLLSFLLQPKKNKLGNKTRRRPTTADQRLVGKHEHSGFILLGDGKKQNSSRLMKRQLHYLFYSHQVIVRGRLAPLPLTRCIQLPWYWIIIWPPSHESRLHYTAIFHNKMPISIRRIKACVSSIFFLI